MSLNGEGGKCCRHEPTQLDTSQHDLSGQKVDLTKSEKQTVRKVRQENYTCTLDKRNGTLTESSTRTLTH